MANVTFSNPEYKTKTVYAVAGSLKQTVLELAKENHIPIDFCCGDGECGTCLVKVTSLDKKHERLGGPLTDKEVHVLRELGKLTPEEVEQMHIDDLPTTWRLACEMILRDEDILIEY